jgi:hypothetical protein
MTKKHVTMDTIETSAEHAENAVLPTIREVHIKKDQPCPSTQTLPLALQDPATKKSEAQWAYERLILYIHNFEKQLDNDHEVGVGFAGGGAGIIRIEGLGFFDPDIITYYGTDAGGARTQLIQHVSQLSVMLQASPKLDAQQEPTRIGFELVKALGPDAAT